MIVVADPVEVLSFRKDTPRASPPSGPKHPNGTVGLSGATNSKGVLYFPPKEISPLERRTQLAAEALALTRDAFRSSADRFFSVATVKNLALGFAEDLKTIGKSTLIGAGGGATIGGVAGVVVGIAGGGVGAPATAALGAGAGALAGGVLGFGAGTVWCLGKGVLSFAHEVGGIIVGGTYATYGVLTDNREYVVRGGEKLGSSLFSVPATVGTFLLTKKALRSLPVGSKPAKTAVPDYHPGKFSRYLPLPFARVDMMQYLIDLCWSKKELQRKSHFANTLLAGSGTEVPMGFETDMLRVRMLTVGDVFKDYDAVMTSMNHLQQTKPFGSNHNWPTKELRIWQNLIDLGWHQKEFQRGSSFAYTVMSPDEKRCLGCVYIYPSPNSEYDAKIIMWVRESEMSNGLDEHLFTAVKKWIENEWKFENPGYPGRKVNWETWNSLK
jgi:hypothetical protein